jgi:hypothetical protein
VTYKKLRGEKRTEQEEKKRRGVFVGTDLVG